MNPPTFYLETSVWGSFGRHQPKDRKQAVVRLLQLLDGVRGICVISDVVFAEVEAAVADEAEQIRRHIDGHAPVVYPISAEMEELAGVYLAEKVLPASRRADALHVAAATCLQMDYLVSWNHRHMTRPMKRLQYESVNRLRGYLKTPLICNPFEACNELRTR